jgi:molybdenum cofactor sulfurtransferase
VARPTAPVIHAPPPVVARNRLRKSFDYSIGSSPGSSVTSISSAGLPRSQSSNLIGMRPTPNISRRRSILSHSDPKTGAEKWDSFWREETNALVAAGAVETEAGLFAASTTDAKKKEKQNEKEMSGLRKVARALALSRRHH